MKYNQPFDQPLSPNAPYIDGNPSTGIAGSIPPAAMMEFTQREIVAVIAASGQSPDNGDLQQFLKAVRGDVLGYYVDQGAVNAYAVNPLPVYIGAPPTGTRFRVRMAVSAPTGDSTFQVNANVPAPIRKSGGLALTGGEWAVGDIVSLTWDGTYYQYSGASGASSLVVSQSLILNVPSQYPTIQAAVIAASKFIIASNVTVKIVVTPPTPGTPYIENLGTGTGPIDIRMPYGNNVQIVGPALSGNFPTRAEITGKTKSQVLTLLQSRFNVIINAVGVDGIQVHEGGLNLLANVLVVCDSTAGRFAIKVGDWQTDIGTGFLGVSNVWVHGAGQNGFDAQFLAAVRATNLGSTYCNYDGIRSAHGCNIEVNFGNVLSMYHGGNGVYCANDGQFSIDSSSGTCDFAYNTKSGINCAATGKANLLPATGVYLGNNGQWGAYAFGQGLINLPMQTTFSGNGSGDLFAGLNSNITAAGATVGTCSPAKNTNGNQYSYIVV